MKIQLLVTIEVKPREKQSRKDFEKEDGKAMMPYLIEKIRDAVAPYDTWQYNAQVTRCTIKKAN